VDNQIPEEKIAVLDKIVRGLSTAVKNSALYEPGHPVFKSSIDNLKNVIDEWLRDEEELALGVSQDNLLLYGENVREGNDAYRSVAEYMHRRGIMGLTVKGEVGLDELTGFITAMKGDEKVLRDRGGILKVLPDMANITVKALDYSELLGSALEEVTDEEEDVFKSLCDVGTRSRSGALPVSKQEFLTEFLKNSKKSAGVLNKIYKNAVAKVEDDSAVEDIRATVGRITKYFEKESGSGSLNARKELADVIGKLDPKLVAKIFEGEKIDGESRDLAEEITKDFSDNMLGDFISSLIGSEGGVNENLMKLFDKLVPQQERAGNIASLVTDNLLSDKMLDKDSLAALQSSMKELVKNRPENDFMSQMYRITVDTFVSDTLEGAARSAKLGRLVREFTEQMNEDNIRSGKIQLILNLVWIEKDPDEIKKLTGRVQSYFPQLIKAGDIESIKKILELYCGKLGSDDAVRERLGDGIAAGVVNDVQESVKKVIELLNDKKTVDMVISAIPDADNNVLENIAYIFSEIEKEHKDQLLDEFVFEEDPFNKDKYLYVFSKMGKAISEELAARVEYSENSGVIKDLFRVLKAVDAVKSREVMHKLLLRKDNEVRLEALKGYSPESPGEINAMFKMFISEKDEEVRKSVLKTLVETRDSGVIEKLLNKTAKDMRYKKYLLPLVKLCGDNKIEESIPSLSGILFKKTFINTARTDELRIAAAVSLGQINTRESMELVKKALKSNREGVKSMCGIILRLEEDGQEPDKG